MRRSEYRSPIKVMSVVPSRPFLALPQENSTIMRRPRCLKDVDAYIERLEAKKQEGVVFNSQFCENLGDYFISVGNTIKDFSNN